MREELFQKFLKDYFGHSDFTITPLQQSGSARQNLIIETSDNKYILTFNEKIDENESFFYLTNAFYNLQLQVPEIYAINAERNLYLQQYVGSNTLSEVITKEGQSERVKNLVGKTIKALSNFQQKTSGNIDFSNAYEYEAYDSFPVTHDLYYFKNFLVDTLEIDYHKGKILKEFQHISDKVQSLQPHTVMMRDFQARNIMVDDQDEIYFIDYQAAMLGPATYDLVSFLFQAKANFSKEWKNEFLSEYLALNKDSFSEDSFKEAVNYCKLMRFLQVLGAYGFRGLIQRKKHFIESLNQGIKNINELKEQWTEINNYPELSKVITELQSVNTQQKVNQLING
ncbi:aminoglycoside phosphotransferase family protein [Elizabethkingia miricola]|uniref:aminoglycoside phosphotransferase family protein n=1 Tax=Elizabethkingia miricola TaxID=172045 RepID=UPI000B355971|nr:phosphotransferase [Elizabethkingia miricola]NHQ65480.1 aminoglycoside phosphotransferase family protein [Elizabethkingia miricola]NHQ69187.1 aminoglycoside phosphotransferase family protein [Elizabethkingia miricola]NHQ76325.1 aminoglycoside phosphotransferase family protein [Elizabethkingia miricola]PSL90399.1 aminoglycoside phosphotransferase [Elizabethkingia miricola]QHQ86805.1 aminoglycoside phosphotransferase [Elizabethkingia miricola]